MKRHYLYSIDLETQTAFCSVCGFTKIYVPKSRTGVPSKIKCKAKAIDAHEARLEADERQREENRSKPNWKPRHSISEVDPETLRGICSICGPVDVRKKVSTKYTGYGCAVVAREWFRERNRLRYVSRPTNPHALSQIDEDKHTAICATCGPVKIEIYYGAKNLVRRCINARDNETISNEEYQEAVTAKP